MAYLLFTLDNSVSFMAKDIEQLKLQFPSYGQFENGKAGKMITLSDEDFKRIQSNESFNFDGTNLNFTGTQTYIHDEDGMKEYISHLIEKIDSIYTRYKNTSFGSDLAAYKNLLGTVDTSLFTYPYNDSLEKYLQDQGHSVISTLQML